MVVGEVLQFKWSL